MSRLDQMSDGSRKQFETQMQIRNNSKELNEMWSELNTWEDEIKRKDRKLIDGEEADSSTGFYDLLDEGEDFLSDVNPEVMNEEELHEHAKTVSQKFTEENQEAIAAKAGAGERIKPKTYQEYNKWDAFDVDAELKSFDEKERKMQLERKKKAAADERRKEVEKRRRKKDNKEEARDLKEEGNEAFKKGDYEEALDCYTLSLAADATVFQTYCNRAMVLLKLDRPEAAEDDAEKAIKLNIRFTKAYMRRGAAREAQGKLEEALEDFEYAKTLEPMNKETRKLIKQVRCKLGLEEAEEEEVDPYTTMEVTVVDYGSDSDYETMEDPNLPDLEPAEEEKQDMALQAREMPAHLRKRSALSIPKNATQFEQEWQNTLAGDLPGRASYISQITPIKLGVLLKQGIEAEVFSDILQVANTSMLAEEAIDVLVALSKTKRFDMNMMMATTADKRAAADVIEAATVMGDAASAPVLRSLRHKYEVA